MKKHWSFYSHWLIILTNWKQEKKLRFHAHQFILFNQLKQGKTLKFWRLRLILHKNMNQEKCWGFAPHLSNKKKLKLSLSMTNPHLPIKTRNKTWKFHTHCLIILISFKQITNCWGFCVQLNPHQVLKQKIAEVFTLITLFSSLN